MEMLSSVMRMAILDMIFGSFHLAKPAKFTSFCPTTGISIALFVMDTVPVCLYEYIAIRRKKSSSTIANYGNSMATFHLSRSSDVDTAHSLIVNFNQHTDTAKEAQIEPKSSVLTTSRQSS